MGVSDGGIPAENLPQCWSDDVRMNALFAPFRLKTANPESWDMKMKFWSDMLRVWCRCRDNPIVSAADAKVAFQRKGRTPQCIEIVVEELYRSNDLAPITKYQQILHNGPEGWVKWGARLAFKPAAIALTAVSYLLPKKTAVDNDGLPKATIDATQRFVVESAVEEQATKLIQDFPPGVERIGTIEQLMKRAGSTCKEAFEVLLGYLVSRGFAAKKGDYVKLAESTSKVDPITESDEALVRLLQAEEKLTRDVERMTRDIDALAADAKATLQLGNRLAAKNHLRRKHTLQNRVTKCENALENVRQLLQGVRDVEVNKAVVDTYRMSSHAMKRGMEQGGLTEDAVHDTLDDLKDVLESYSDVEKALSAPVEDLDAAELEEELKELMRGGGGGGTPLQEDKDASFTLPSPPRPKARNPSERDYFFDGEARMLAELNELGNDSPRERKEGQKEVRKVKEKVAVAEGWSEPKGKSNGSYFFDGDARMLAELNELGNDSPRERKEGKKDGKKVMEKVAVAEGWSGPKESTPKEKPSKAWYPPKEQFSQDTDLDKSLDELCSSFGELRTDQRLHPGQKLDIDFTAPPKLYNSDFQIQDHTRDERVWLYNRNDDGIPDASPASSNQLRFQMAPGGERGHSAPWSAEPHGADMTDLQARLDSLRGL